MARIDLVDLAHSYGSNQADPETFALKPVTMTWRQGSAYALLPVVRRQGHAVEPDFRHRHAVARQINFDGVDIPCAVNAEAQYCASIPVSRHLRHHDRRPRSRIPPEEPWRAEAGNRRAGEADRDLLDLTPYLNRKATRLTADAKQKISLGRGLVRSDVAAVLFGDR